MVPLIFNSADDSALGRPVMIAAPRSQRTAVARQYHHEEERDT